MSAIHPTAIVHPGAHLAEDVYVGPYSVVGDGVRIGAGSRIGPHCVLEGPLSLGPGNHIYGHASIGGAPQDKKYAGEPTRLEIGARNTIREFCTVNRGTVQDGGVTRIGNDNWIMAYVHVAHDCQVGDHTILANNATLAGHVHLGDWAIVGGLTGVHQFCRIGAHAMTGFQSHVSQDVPPYMTVAGNPLSVHGINAEGLRRRGFSRARLAQVKRMHRVLYRDGLTLEQAMAVLSEPVLDSSATVSELGRLDIGAADKSPEPESLWLNADRELMVAFLAHAKRGIVR